MKKNYSFVILVLFICCFGSEAFSQASRMDLGNTILTKEISNPNPEIQDQLNFDQFLKMKADKNGFDKAKGNYSIFNTAKRNFNNVENTKKEIRLLKSGSPVTESVGVYSPSGPTANTYTAITGSTVSSWRNGADFDDNLSNAIPLGFNYVYEGVLAGSLLVSTNGFVTFNTGTAANGSAGSLYGSTPTNMAVQQAILTVAPMWEDLLLTSLSDIKYETTGDEGSQVFTMQWSNANLWDGTGFNLNFQLKIFEADSHIEFHYGTMTAGTPGANNPLFYVCGLNGTFLGDPPTAAQLLIQQTPNSSTFSANISGGAGVGDSLNALPTSARRISFTPPSQTAPNAPTALNFTNISSTTAQANWTDNSSTEIGFPIYFSTDNVTFNYIGTAPANAVDVTIIGLSPNTPYYMRVYSSVETKISSALSGTFMTNNVNPLSGNYTINPLGPPTLPNFQSFLVADTTLENNGVSGPVTITVSGGTYTDAVTLFSIPGTSATNTVKFVGPASLETRVLIKPVGTVSLADVAILIVGADYVTFENIDVEDGGTTAADQVERGYELLNPGVPDDPCEHVTIKGANITMGGGGTTAPINSAGISVFYNQPGGGFTGTGNVGCKFQNLNINGADRGYLTTNSSGSFLGFEDDSVEISNCKFGETTYIGSTAATSAAVGITTRLQLNVSIHDNTFFSVKGNNAATPNAAIAINNSGASGYIYNNIIKEVYQGNTTSATALAAGIHVGGFATIPPDYIGNVHTYNNFVSNVTKGYTGAASSSVNCYGIRAVLNVNPVASTVNQIFYNTVNMTAPGTVTYSTAAFSDNLTATVFSTTAIDNIFINAISSSGIARGYAIYEQNATNYITSNYNNLYVSGTNGQVGRRSATDYLTLALWTAATGLDANSSSVPVTFANAGTGDLHLAGSSIGDINLIGTPLDSVLTDIDGNKRSSVTPLKGADEAWGLSTLNLTINFESCPSQTAITVQLRSAVSPYALVESVSGMGGAGISTPISFANASPGHPYYVVVSSANALATWSATTVTFTSNTASYNFTTALSQAYGSNMKLATYSPFLPSLYQGDANQDEVIDLTDVLAINNVSIQVPQTSTPNTNLNCDAVTDLADVLIAYANSISVPQISTKKP